MSLHSIFNNPLLRGGAFTLGEVNDALVASLTHSSLWHPLIVHLIHVWIVMAVSLLTGKGLLELHLLLHFLLFIGKDWVLAQVLNSSNLIIAHLISLN